MKTGGQGAPGLPGRDGATVFLGLGINEFGSLTVKTGGSDGGSGGTGGKYENGKNANCALGLGDATNGGPGGKGGQGGQGGYTGYVHIKWLLENSSLDNDPATIIQERAIFESGLGGEGGLGGLGGRGGAGVKCGLWKHGPGNRGSKGQKGSSGLNGKHKPFLVEYTPSGSINFDQNNYFAARNWQTESRTESKLRDQSESSQGNNGEAATLNKRICAQDPVPEGWIKIDDEWDPTSCGSSTTPSTNVLVIARYDNKAIGQVIWACSTSPTPLGWSVYSSTLGFYQLRSSHHAVQQCKDDEAGSLR